MPTTTPNFGWSVPVSTDLVKDGATAIELLGDSIDAALLDLKGGTTGQVLAKASNTDLDFTFVTVDDTNAIQNAIMDAKGDLIGATAADTPARLAVGANGTVLTADSAEATGLKWATPAGGGLTLILAQTIGTGVSSVNVTSAFSATFANYKILVSGGVGSGDAQFALKLGTTTTGYFGFIISGSYSASTVSGGNFSNTANFQGAGIVTTNSISCDFDLQNPNAAKNTHYKSAWAQSNTAGTANTVQGFLNNTTQYTDFTLTPGSGTLTGGTIRVYGYQN